MILVVGHVMRDVIVRPDGPLVPRTDRSATITHRAGGSGANIACWLGAIGVPVRFAGRVGAADCAAQTGLLRRYGVEALLAPDSAAPTGTVVALLSPQGERSFYSDRGANLNLGLADLPPTLLDDVQALHVSGHVFFTEGPRAAAQALMAAAAAKGIDISIDAGSAGWLAESGAASFRAWTRLATLCFANADEAALLEGGYEMFVVTYGAHGAAVRRGSETVRVAGRATEVVDSTGAGDAFAAGFLASRLAGASLEDGLRVANGQAAMCISRAGARPQL